MHALDGRGQTRSFICDGSVAWHYALTQTELSVLTEEWANEGTALLQKGRYFQAMHAFRKAHMLRELAISSAYYLREQAQKMIGGSKMVHAAQRAAFSDAGKAFVGCAHETSSDSEQLTYFGIAGECYASAEDDAEAGRAYLQAKHFTHAAHHFMSAGMFDEAVYVARNHKVAHEVAKKVINVAKIHYLEEKQVE
jgi:tetratricopeptide (TPR) repeat protein